MRLALSILVAFAQLLFYAPLAGSTNISASGSILHVPITDEQYQEVSYGNVDTVTSGPLRLEAWVFPNVYLGGPLNGYKLFQAEVEPLEPGQSATRHFRPEGQVLSWPPDNAGFVTVVISEFDGGPINEGYFPRAYCGANTYLNVGPRPAIPNHFIPVEGMWWNPNESGSGYMLDFRHGTLIVTTYSYTVSGESQWYIASGPVSNSNLFTGRLDKFRNGQCISCPYSGMPQAAGSDGTISIQFHSPISATMTLPGRRVFQIRPMEY